MVLFVSLLLQNMRPCSFSNVTDTLFYQLCMFSLEKSTVRKSKQSQKRENSLCVGTLVQWHVPTLHIQLVLLSLKVWVNFLLGTDQSLTEVKTVSASAGMFSESPPGKTMSLSGKINTLAFGWFTYYFLCWQR